MYPTADASELRVLGCLIEKQRTTPDQYPLSVNALRLACNQSTNRDPVVQYDEQQVRAALHQLSAKGWVRLASGAGSRAVKYRHLFDDALSLSEPEISLLAVLMLRGPQTMGELKTRTERLHRMSVTDVDLTLRGLAERELVEQIPRRPGQKEERWRHLLGNEEPDAAASASAPAPAAALDASVEERLRKLEERVAALEELFA